MLIPLLGTVGILTIMTILPMDLNMDQCLRSMNRNLTDNGVRQRQLTENHHHHHQGCEDDVNILIVTSENMLKRLNGKHFF